MSVPLPGSHLDLLDRPLPAVLTTELPDGRFQSSVVWCNRDGEHVLLNTMREFQKARNLRARPKATVLVVEPDDDRWLEVRGTVELEEQGALEHLDQLSRLYTGKAPYFGAVVPLDQAAVEHPVGIRLIPSAVATGPSRVSGGTRRTSRPTPAGWNRLRDCEGEPPVPASHRDLLELPIVAALSTRLPDGSAQTQPIWCEVDGNDVLVSTTRERRKGRNLEADPRATGLAVDPDDSLRWIEIRGDVDLLQDGADEELDRLTRRYTEHEHFYGSVYPLDRRERETRMIARIHPRRIVCDAIHP